jgi:hypothetical protein
MSIIFLLDLGNSLGAGWGDPVLIENFPGSFVWLNVLDIRSVPGTMKKFVINYLRKQETNSRSNAHINNLI